MYGRVEGVSRATNEKEVGTWHLALGRYHIRSNVPPVKVSAKGALSCVIGFGGKVNNDVTKNIEGQLLQGKHYI